MKQSVNDVNMTINAHILVLKYAVVVVVMQAKLIKIISAEWKVAITHGHSMTNSVIPIWFCLYV